MLKRTIYCGDVRADHVGKELRLNGWVQRRRDHGGLIFIDLRDRSGIIQTVVDPQRSPNAHKIAEQIRSEYVLEIIGTVAMRPEGTENPALPTGEVEVIVSEIEILNTAKTPPFLVQDDVEVDEMVRLKYRYIDLRRPCMQHKLMLRHRVIKMMRDILDARGFIEVETPILLKSTPEGARDYLVPSRLYPGHFYALPQSPQQLKQLLMVAGFEKYFQIARCFRDEDPRADRQPEFTQLDLEMSFCKQEDIMEVINDIYINIVEKLSYKKLPKPFPVFTYEEAMTRFGTDKPDIRYGMELHDITDIAARTDFQVFTNATKAGGKVRGIAMPGCANFSRTQIDEITHIAKTFGAKGLMTIAVTSEGPKSAVAKYFTDEQMAEIIKRMEAHEGDLIGLVADPNPKLVSESLGRLRFEMGKRLKLGDQDTLAFCWVVDFPLFEWNEEEKRWDSTHHPFTSPHEEDLHLLDTDPGKVRSYAYDFVCNGAELASGSIRIHRRDIQSKVFKLLNFSEEEAHARFGHMLEAFEYGAPPHGGIAPGIDRTIMLLLDEENIREVMAFPKTATGQDPMTECPSLVDEKQLKELHIKILEED